MRNQKVVFLLLAGLLFFAWPLPITAQESVAEAFAAAGVFAAASAEPSVRRQIAVWNEQGWPEGVGYVVSIRIGEGEEWRPVWKFYLTEDSPALRAWLTAAFGGEVPLEFGQTDISFPRLRAVYDGVLRQTRWDLGIKHVRIEGGRVVAEVSELTVDRTKARLTEQFGPLIRVDPRYSFSGYPEIFFQNAYGDRRDPQFLPITLEIWLAAGVLLPAGTLLGGLFAWIYISIGRGLGKTGPKKRRGLRFMAVLGCEILLLGAAYGVLAQVNYQKLRKEPVFRMKSHVLEFPLGGYQKIARQANKGGNGILRNVVTHSKFYRNGEDNAQAYADVYAYYEGKACAAGKTAEEFASYAAEEGNAYLIYKKSHNLLYGYLLGREILHRAKIPVTAEEIDAAWQRITFEAPGAFDAPWEKPPTGIAWPGLAEAIAVTEKAEEVLQSIR